MVQDLTSALVGVCQRWVGMSHLVVNYAATPEPEAVPFFLGTLGFFILLIGVLLTLAFQLLLATFFIALGISYADEPAEQHPDDDLDDTINRIGVIVGLRTLGTACITLFGACFLAVKLAQVPEVMLGAVLGLSIWAAYFTTLIWISATTVGSLIGTVINTATSGLHGLIGTAAVALGAKTVSEQVVSTADAAATSIRRELSSAVEPAETRQAIAKYLKSLQLPEEDRQDIQREFEALVAEPEMKEIAKENHLHNIGRQTFVDLVSARTDVPKQNIDWAVDQMEIFWHQLWGEQAQAERRPEGTLALATAQMEETKPKQLSGELEDLIEMTRKRHAKQQAEATQKVAETAAWWLFATAFTSGATAAAAGTIAILY